MFASGWFNNEHLTEQPRAEIDTTSGAGDLSFVGPLFMAGFEGVNLMVQEFDRTLVSEADEWQRMQCVDPTAPPYGEAPPASLENCPWRGPLYAPGECQEMPGTDPDCETRLESSTVRTRKGVGEPKVVLDRSVLREKAIRKLTLKVTAKELGVCPTALKTHSRKLGIKNWRLFCKAP